MNVPMQERSVIVLFWEAGQLNGEVYFERFGGDKVGLFGTWRRGGKGVSKVR
jgi:hypothetical protein